jgi:hypothetical protein
MASLTQEPVVFNKFAGLRNDTDPANFEIGDLVDATNCDVDNAARIAVRSGQVKRLTGSYHSLWARGDLCLVVSGTTLFSVIASGTTYTAIPLRDGLTAGARLSYWPLVDRVYYCNAFETGCVQNGANRTWGIVPPKGQPIASAIGGGLLAGRYQYAVTFLRGDGQESGTPIAGQVQLPTGGGIYFSSIPVSADPGVTAKLIYISNPNGEVCYKALLIANADTTAAYMNAGLDLRLPLSTQFGQPAPAGHMCAWHLGRMLDAVGPNVMYSEAFKYELFMPDTSFLPFDADINLLAPVNDGVYIGADSTFFYEGQLPPAHSKIKGAEYKLNIVAPYGAIPGTLAYEDGAYVGQGIPGVTAYWSSPRGHCVGTDKGSFKNLTESRYSIASGQRGGAIVRQSKGMNQYLAVIEGSGLPNNAY